MPLQIQPYTWTNIHHDGSRETTEGFRIRNGRSHIFVPQTEALNLATAIADLLEQQNKEKHS